jgi:hypothetical protein
MGKRLSDEDYMKRIEEVVARADLRLNRVLPRLRKEAAENLAKREARLAAITDEKLRKSAEAWGK